MTAQGLRKKQEKQVRKALLNRHIASAQRQKNPIVAQHARLVGQALLSLANHGASSEATILTNALDAYEAEIERLTTLLEEKELSHL